MYVCTVHHVMKFMYVYMHTLMDEDVCIYVCMHVYCMNACMYCMYAYVCVYIYTLYACISYECMYVYMYVCMCIHILPHQANQPVQVQCSTTKFPPDQKLAFCISSFRVASLMVNLLSNALLPSPFK